MAAGTHRLDTGRRGKQEREVVAAEAERVLKYRFAVGVLDTTITREHIAEGQGPRLRLTHEGCDLDSPLGGQALEGMKPGWPKVLERLEAALAA